MFFVLLVAKLGCPEVNQNHDKTKRLTQKIRSIKIKETADRAEINKKAEEYCW